MYVKSSYCCMIAQRKESDTASAPACRFDSCSNELSLQLEIACRTSCITENNVLDDFTGTANGQHLHVGKHR